MGRPSVSLCWIFVCLCFVQVSQQQNPLPTIKEYNDAENQARTNPKSMADFISTEYKAKVPAGSKIHSVWKITFNEDCPAVFDGAITFMNAATALGSLELDLGMTYAAWKHAKWMVDKNNGDLSHTGENGSSFSTRLKEYTTQTMGASAENILYTGSGAVTARIMVANYIIDDGVSSRGHRANIMNGVYKKAGVGLYYDSNKKRYYQVSVFADKYTCDKCSAIDCQMQKDCGWRKYLSDSGKSDPCPSDSAAGLLQTLAAIAILVVWVL